MNGGGQPPSAGRGGRSGPRVYSLREIEVSYEGRDEHLIVKPPNLSCHGMFVNTTRSFPEGAVLSLRFTLLRTGAEVHTRGEVRYCEPGVGVGVEFIDLSPEASRLIEREIALSTGKGRRAPLAAKRSASRTQTPRRR